MKKAILILIIFVMAAGIFAGCNDAGNGGEAGNNGTVDEPDRIYASGEFTIPEPEPNPAMAEFAQQRQAAQDKLSGSLGIEQTIMKTTYSARGNALVYATQFTAFGNRDTAEKSMEASQNTYQILLSSIKEKDAECYLIVEFLDKDGRVLLSQDYK